MTTSNVKNNQVEIDKHFAITGRRDENGDIIFVHLGELSLNGIKEAGIRTIKESMKENVSGNAMKALMLRYSLIKLKSEKDPQAIVDRSVQAVRDAGLFMHTYNANIEREAKRFIKSAALYGDSEKELAELFVSGFNERKSKVMEGNNAIAA